MASSAVDRRDLAAEEADPKKKETGEAHRHRNGYQQDTSLTEESDAKKEKKPIKLGTEVSKFVVYMMEKHGDDFDRMQRDKKNVYQYSAGQIKGLIKKFL